MNRGDGTSWWSWGSKCDRRTWCNTGFRQALSDDLRPAFKQFQTLYYDARSIARQNMECTDYFALAASAEVFKGDSKFGTGSAEGEKNGYSHQEEFLALTRFTWYETVSNRVKIIPNYEGYFTRSVAIWEDNGVACVELSSTYYPNGYPVVHGFSNTQGISPFGCM